MDFATRDADTAFAELIYADAQWLREEFDALIAASFGQPPAAPPPARTSPRPARPAPGQRTALPMHTRPALVSFPHDVATGT